LRSNEKRAIIIAGATTLLGFIFFCIAGGATEYYHAYLPAQLAIVNPLNWQGALRVGYGPYRRCVKPDNADGFCDFVNRACYPGIDITGQLLNADGVTYTYIQAGYGMPLTNCDHFNALRAFHVIALVVSGIAGLVILAAAWKNVSFTLVVILGFTASAAGVISSVIGGELITSFNTSTFTDVIPVAIAFDYGYGFVLSVFGWALTFASTGLYIAAKWDEKVDLKQ